MHGGPTPVPTLHGEYLVVPERLIVAPSSGRFVTDHTPHDLRAGEMVGRVVRSDGVTPVYSNFSGTFMGHLAADGQRVRDGQPLAWIRLAG